MTVANQNFKAYRANSFTLNIDLTQADGSPFDPTLPGVIFRWRMMNNWHGTDQEALVRKQSGGEGITLTATGIEIILEPQDLDLPPGFYYHELKILDGTDVATVTTGTAIVKRAAGMGEYSIPGAAQLKLSGTVPTRVP